MTAWRLILASLRNYAALHLAVGLGVVAATAVLTGALLVGDSVRGSLRDLALEGLGRIDELLISDRFFRAELATELAAALAEADHDAASGEARDAHDRVGAPRVDGARAVAARAGGALAGGALAGGAHAGSTEVVPAILIEGTVERPGVERPGGRRVSGVTLVGVTERFWSLFPGTSPESLAPGEVLLNAPLAEELGVSVGDEVIVRLPRPSEIPGDSPLGRKTDTVRNRRLEVVGILPAQGPGRFALRPNQQVPLCAYMPLGALEQAIEQPGRVNALLVARRDAAGPPPPSAPSPMLHEQLQALFKPTAADYGLNVTGTPRGYVQIASERMLLEPPLERSIVASLAGERWQPSLTYLANTLALGEREVPYSTVTAVDFETEPPLGPLVDAEGHPLATPGAGQIVLNSWAAQQLEARVGDTIRLDYFAPESTHGQVIERSVELELSGIVALEGAAADPDWTPELKGVTDQASIADWDPPFPFEAARIRDVDEEYWDQHRTTPKAFVSLATGRRLWGSRFGQTTSIRVAPPAADEPAPSADGAVDTPLDEHTGEALDDALADRFATAIAAQLAIDPADAGFVFRPVKRDALAAATGTTPFDVLFLSFSFFLIAAAVLLVALLFRLAIEDRAAQIGLLLAVGLTQRQVSRLLFAEGALVALVGGAVGVAGGLAYAWLMILGLSTWWVEAIVTPFLTLHVQPLSLAIGGASGALVAAIAIAATLRTLARVSARRLLAGSASVEGEWLPATPRVSRWLGRGLLAVAVAIAVAALGLSGEAQAGAFFGSGAAVLGGLLALLWARLRTGATGAMIVPGKRSFIRRGLRGSAARIADAALLYARPEVSRLALRNAARHPGRSVLTVGLVAAATFLIGALAAFRLDVPSAHERDSGTGGLALVAESSQPIYQSVASADALGIFGPDAELFAQCTIFPLRVRAGDDASCLNLYRPQQPQLVGMSAALIERGGFAWAASAADDAATRANPWRLLERHMEPAADGTPRLPAVLDANTATYSLHVSGVGDSFDVPDGRGGRLRLEVVGLLQTSIWQGLVLVDEAQLLAQFPELGGYQMFVVDAPPGAGPQVAELLERALGDWGFDAQDTARRLAGYLVVQNTYISTFQTLGGLGLLLGTVGLVAVELRSVLERRGELALLRAVGFRNADLAWLVIAENEALLVAGLGVGLASALVAVAPHMAGGAATVPVLGLVVLVVQVLAIGIAAGIVAVWQVLHAPLVAALRGQ